MCVLFFSSHSSKFILWSGFWRHPDDKTFEWTPSCHSEGHKIKSRHANNLKSQKYEPAHNKILTRKILILNHGFLHLFSWKNNVFVLFYLRVCCVQKKGIFSEWGVVCVELKIFPLILISAETHTFFRTWMYFNLDFLENTFWDTSFTVLIVQFWLEELVLLERKENCRFSKMY